MKGFLMFFPFLTVTPLYPTWFRWKEAPQKRPTLWYRIFISHMVQMKASSAETQRIASQTFISHMVQMKDALCQWSSRRRWSLYPTWFRWKLTIFIKMSYRGSFISHMVQMKELNISGFSNFSNALYPTWFRWKVGLALLGVAAAITFISHMVQMKVSVTRC